MLNGKQHIARIQSKIRALHACADSIPPDTKSDNVKNNFNVFIGNLLFCEAKIEVADFLTNN